MTAIEPLLQAAPLIGRRTEIERITVLIDRVVSGRGGAFVLVEGEPGIGRTSLLHNVVGIALAQGMWVLLGAATEVERSIPGTAIGSCVSLGERGGNTVGHRLGALFDGVGECGALSEFAATAAISDLLSQWCSDGPVAVLVDDIHWADAASLSVLRWLSVAVDTLPLLVVATMRPYPLGPGLPRLLSEFDAVGARRMVLGPLVDEDVGRLVERSLGAPPGPQLTSLTAGVAGNPLYLNDLLDGFTADGSGTAARTGLPAALSETLARRLDFLPESVRHTLEVAAALTPRIDPVKLAEILDVSLIDVWNETRTAVEARVLMHDGDELVFRHELIRRVLADQVSPSIRATLRRHVEAAGLHTQRIAEPADPATRPARPTAELDRVAERIEGTVAAAAAESLVESLPTPNDGTTVLLLRGLADGDVDLVAEAVAEFAQSDRPRFAALAGENLAEMLVRNGRTAEACAALEAAVGRYEALDAAAETGRVRARLRALGVRRVGRGPRGRPETGWAALTVTERKVAVQVARGCSNADIAEKMFLSRRTVQTHVSRILAKLGLRSRVQVAVAYAQRR